MGDVDLRVSSGAGCLVAQAVTDGGWKLALYIDERAASAGGRSNRESTPAGRGDANLGPSWAASRA